MRGLSEAGYEISFALDCMGVAIIQFGGEDKDGWHIGWHQGEI